ncbi:tol-pal system protein YbgF [Neorhizobium sp. NCHU2750]|uniref:tol-pal system protein YbgF n=1 Tax=Neorhizobium sp. NCHU2750 TaxID=1825976 RepID=UPI000E720EE4|nr:tol-pal system protein [Neorhizobium sp. NCHU2750]
MKKIVLAAMLGLAAMTGPAGAFQFSLPKLFHGEQSAPQQAQNDQAPEQGQVILAQSNDAVRIQQLQDEVRQLNGRIEEMSYQLLQMQEQMRKAQEDNEFRFQELEKKKRSDLGDTGGQPAVASSRPSSSPSQASDAPSGGDDVARVIDQPPSAGGAQGSDTAPGPSTLGSVTFDQNGNPIGSSRNDTARNSSALPGVDTGASRGGQAGSKDQQQTASLGTGSEADDYKIAYEHVLTGDYQLAESEFSGYIASYPKSSRLADANFWLGEAQYSQGKYNDAAKTFLNAHQTYGKSPKAPEMLLKLGMSLAALDNNDTACATLKEVPRRYPTAAKAVLSKVSSEQKRLGC